MIRSFTYLLLAGATAGLTGFNAAATGAAPAQLPFYFESNGSTFQASGPGAQCIISPAGATLTLQDGKAAPATVRLQFAGANPRTAFHGETVAGGKINHLIGSETSQWQLNQSAFGKVRADDIYPGISAIFYGNARRLEYDLSVAPGAKPETIALQFAGADKITVSQDGQLLLAVAGREISQPAPVVYQTIDGNRHEIAGSYQLVDSKTVSFKIGDYDHSQPLVIDPYLSFSTYFGGNQTDVPLAVTVDSQGYIYLAGSTLSTLFTNNIPSGYKTNFQGGAYSGDGFVAKFDAQGSNLVYFTYLGGNSEDGVECIAVDTQGQAYVSGFTQSANFPTNNTFAPLTNKISGQLIPRLGVYPTDVFVSKLSADGTSLIYSGYLGGDQSDSVAALALDTNRSIIYITGYTYSTNFPTSPNAYQNHFKAPYSLYYNANAFVTVLGTGYATAFSGTGNSYYSTYLGGTNLDAGTGIGLDGAGNVYVAGYTSSTNFPATNSLSGMIRLNGSTNTQPVFSAYPYDAFVAKFSPGGTNLIYSTFLGGTNNDQANAIAVDAAGDAYVTGWTISTNFPNSNPNLIANQSFITNNLTGLFTTNSFVVMITNGPSNVPKIAHSAVFGGLAADVANAVALDANTNIYIVGSTSSTNFPVTGAVATPRGTNSGGNDVFITAIKTDWSGLLYSTYLGGSLDDFGYAIAVDAAGNAYVTGTTISSAVTSTIGFPVWGARQTVLDGTSDGFLAKIAPATPTYSLVYNYSKTNYTLSWIRLGYAPPSVLALETSTNLVNTNWVTPTGGIWITNATGYQYSLGYTNRSQLFSNKAIFFRLHKPDNF